MISLLALRLKVWDNSYFMDLLEYDWVKEDSPGGNIQWIPVPKADATDTDVPDIIMLTADIALIFVRPFPSPPALCLKPPTVQLAPKTFSSLSPSLSSRLV